MLTDHHLKNVAPRARTNELLAREPWHAANNKVRQLGWLT